MSPENMTAINSISRLKWEKKNSSNDSEPKKKFLFNDFFTSYFSMEKKLSGKFCQMELGRITSACIDRV